MNRRVCFKVHSDFHFEYGNYFKLMNYLNGLILGGLKFREIETRIERGEINFYSKDNLRRGLINLSDNPLATASARDLT